MQKPRFFVNQYNKKLRHASLIVMKICVDRMICGLEWRSNEVPSRLLSNFLKRVQASKQTNNRQTRNATVHETTWCVQKRQHAPSLPVTQRQSVDATIHTHISLSLTHLACQLGGEIFNSMATLHRPVIHEVKSKQLVAKEGRYQPAWQNYGVFFQDLVHAGTRSVFPDLCLATQLYHVRQLMEHPPNSTARDLTIEAATTASQNANRNYGARIVPNAGGVASSKEIRKFLASRHDRDILDGLRRVVAV